MEGWKEGRVEEANSRTHKRSRPGGAIGALFRIFYQDLLSYSLFIRLIVIPYYTLRCWKLRFLRVKKWSVSFAGCRRSFHRFPTVAIRRRFLWEFYRGRYSLP